MIKKKILTLIIRSGFDIVIVVDNIEVVYFYKIKVNF